MLADIAVRRPRGVPPICRASPGGRRGLDARRRSRLPRAVREASRPFSFPRRIDQMITSPHNEKLKLIRKLAGAQAPRARGPVRGRGRGPGRGRARRAGASRELSSLARAGRDEVEPALLDAVSDARVGDAGDRGLPAALGRRRRSRPASTCTASPTRATSARSSAPRTRSADGPVVLGPGCADPYSPKAVRASMGLVFARRPARGGLARARRHREVGAGRARRRAARRARPRVAGRRLPRRRARGPAGGASVDACDASATIPLRRRAPSRSTSRPRRRSRSTSSDSDRPAMADGLSGSSELRSGGGGGDRRGRRRPPSSRSCGSATWAARPS